jgi:hypothetical protein
MDKEAFEGLIGLHLFCVFVEMHFYLDMTGY